MERGQDAQESIASLVASMDGKTTQKALALLQAGAIHGDETINTLVFIFKLKTLGSQDDPEAKMALERLPIIEAATAGRYDEALRLEETLAAKVEAEEIKRDGKPGEDTADELLQMTWSALLAKDYTKALAVADHAHALFPENLGIEIKWAHALMFKGHDQEAKAVYLAVSGPLSQTIADDFANLRKAGLTSPMMAEVEKELGVSP